MEKAEWRARGGKQEARRDGSHSRRQCSAVRWGLEKESRAERAGAKGSLGAKELEVGNPGWGFETTQHDRPRRLWLCSLQQGRRPLNHAGPQEVVACLTAHENNYGH